MRLLIALIALMTVALPARAQQAWPASYPEGPVWIGKTLYWAEMWSHRVMTWQGGEPQVFLEHHGCGPTAIAPYRDGEIIVLCHLAASLLRVSPNGEVIGTLSSASDGTALRNPNDASADNQGGVWFTDPGRFSISAPNEGRLYYLSSSGEITLHDQDLAYGNGVFVDLTEKRLLLSEHLGRRVLSYSLTADGLGPRETLFVLDDFELPASRFPETGPDGLEIGPDGTLWVAEYGATRLLGWQPGRGLVAALQVDPQFVTNIAFGPEGRAALTGAEDNINPPFPGAVWVFDALHLTEAAKPR